MLTTIIHILGGLLLAAVLIFAAAHCFLTNEDQD